MDTAWIVLISWCSIAVLGGILLGRGIRGN